MKTAGTKSSNEKRRTELLEAAREAAFLAAEAMDRRDLVEWTKQQNRAEALRKRAANFGYTKTPVMRKRRKRSDHE